MITKANPTPANIAEEYGTGRTHPTPMEILEEAQNCASNLRAVVSLKKEPVMYKGEQYLEFEDWQTVGKFYFLSVGVEWSRYLEIPGATCVTRGFEARAIVRDESGQVVSSAEALCLQDEPNWKAKPLFQLRSMAQTRACAKALRNVLAWVVVLAGYRPTPAEEMQGLIAEKGNGNGHAAPPVAPAAKVEAPTVVPTVKMEGLIENAPENVTPADIFRLARAGGFTKADGMGAEILDFTKLGDYLASLALPRMVKLMKPLELAAAWLAISTKIADAEVEKEQLVG